ncbi:2Fe-2S iron-sulfur cluster binding domain-containing protein [Candidatus Sulfurimonas marisnigri]|uniref:2Fe-2S iron-sulfur cluster binding domain-containing protein n=1 Tax=Candidatus Sulfurimonas marisnigri TaxID=2740405 RepID=A0A7S7RPS5_9BACT|nr:2Fe-2S iron-sulfur cluster binding domain-containing protein [Candidatus Sulfurimonas marisnigri]QOY53818.1 2Fe-2S iron-sulfur cluster binding domain-containing protein [Candidatus Sulfurimonas marisnigri]
MAKVIFIGFSKDKDGLYHAPKGEPIIRLAKENGIAINFECQDGECGNCLIKYENIEDEEPTNYIDDLELNKLIEMGVMNSKDAEYCQQFTISPKVRLACQTLVKGDVIIKPFL